ncbi:DUF4231 domain-containing protein [Anabaena sp. FACHB-709]|uniref:DUF4231 domain-containing protein n=2 Tax=Nostocaceae TaxID=1162 RepID=A0A1Z4KU43_ANAVA|nr:MULTISPECIES: DUF4231 domain-containing protein [Nostocaceae]BAY72551.1 hypothetical protein NIES23_53790 [Trichormus variabilis NIES-23]HBW31807.1 DUF4231 domain-containing protein [Nostoc sp. UBA8866]MBD2174526.1 DUF4231 domain-containing protein [Anabaena cylindrica FACHB-318]MBD2266320.1 DUF4231 domain-containing protein [Anabaena sp. FACHB-709]MBD2275702.1 DUF4231 domain-containing protein [Nostoc sp. PCC 7120 = FACHB-418]
MANKDDYQEFLKGKFTNLIDSLNLSELQTQFLFSRWLDQMLWMERQAGKSRNRYYRLRLVTIIGGVALPALVSLNINSSQVREIFVWATFSLSQVVAISAAVEEFFHYGERWRHYRRTAESLKTQGWQFFQLTGPYVNYETHDKAFSNFANQVEEIIQRDVEVYATQVVQEKKQQDNGNDDKQDNVKENEESKV